MDISKYLGDPSKADFMSSGKPTLYKDGMLLTMAPDTVGTTLSTTSYIWYGEVSAKLKTSRGAGVVTAFILMSDTKDEIDVLGVAVCDWQGKLGHFVDADAEYVIRRKGEVEMKKKKSPLQFRIEGN